MGSKVIDILSIFSLCSRYEERDFTTPSGKRVDFIKVDVLDKIRTKIEQAADKEFQIAMGIADLNERYTHIQMKNAYRHSLNIIDNYKSEGGDKE